jgi:hypothetical protein
VHLLLYGWRSKSISLNFTYVLSYSHTTGTLTSIWMTKRVWGWGWGVSMIK